MTSVVRDPEGIRNATPEEEANIAGFVKKLFKSSLTALEAARDGGA